MFRESEVIRSPYGALMNWHKVGARVWALRPALVPDDTFKDAREAQRWRWTDGENGTFCIVVHVPTISNLLAVGVEPELHVSRHTNRKAKCG